MIFIQSARYKDTSIFLFINSLHQVLKLEDSLQVFDKSIVQVKCLMEFPILSKNKNLGFADGTVFVCWISYFERRLEQQLQPPFPLVVLSLSKLCGPMSTHLRNVHIIFDGLYLLKVPANSQILLMIFFLICFKSFHKDFISFSLIAA